MTLARVVDGKVRLSCNPAQALALSSTARYTFLLVGSQSGKTTLGPWWLWREIQRCGPGDYLAVTATYDLFKLKLLPEMLGVFVHTLGVAEYSKSDKVLRLKDPVTGKLENERGEPWGRIVLRSANAEGGLESATAKAALLDECGQDEFQVTAWEAVLRRLAIHRGRVLGTTTPYNLGWVKQQVMDRCVQAPVYMQEVPGGHARVYHGPDLAVVNAPSTVNPAFPMAEFEERRERMPGWRFDMFYRGMFSRPPGLVYADYKDTDKAEGGHVVEDFQIPPVWPRYVGVDFGAVNTALVWVAEDPATNVLYVYRESLEGGMTTREHAQRALEYAARENVAWWVGGAPSEKQQRWDWQSAGVSIQQPPISDVESGINRVTELLKTRRLYIFRSLSGLRDELGTYSRKTTDAGDVLVDIVNKQTYHRLDALRYMATGLVLGGSDARLMV